MASDATQRNIGGIEEPLRALRRRWYLVAICVVLTPLAALGFSLTQEERYMASATLLFEESNLDEELFGTTATSNVDQERAAATNRALASLKIVRDRTATALSKRLRRPVNPDVRVTQTNTNNLATVEATDRDPRAAALIATTFAREFIRFRRDAASSSVDRAILLLTRRITRLERDSGSLAEIRQLQSRKQDLENLSAIQTGNVQLVEPATIPESASEPKTSRNVALGAFLGLLLGLGLALAVDRLDRRLRDTEDIEDAIGTQVLGLIPESRALARQSGGLDQLHASDVEAFRLLRADLRYFRGSQGASCILVTSSAPGEGKSTIAWNLALCAAESGGRTLLIEADLRRPALQSRLRAIAGSGLSGVLSGQSSLDEALYSHVEHGGPQLDILFAGPKPPNPADLLESDAMKALLASSRENYELVIIDSAPIPIVADSIPLLSEVDGVLVIARLRQTTRDAALHLRRQLTRLNSSVLGVVVNGGERFGDYVSYAESASSAPAAVTASRPDESERSLSRSSS